jgi:hypothetical protein
MTQGPVPRKEFFGTGPRGRGLKSFSPCISYLLSRVPEKKRETPEKTEKIEKNRKNWKKPEKPKKTEKPEKLEKTDKNGKSRKRREKGSQNIKACRIENTLKLVTSP